MAPSSRPLPLRSPLPALTDAPRARALAAICLFLATYPLMAAGSGRFSADGVATPWYPAAGLGMAFLTIAGARFAPLLLLAILAGAWLGGPPALTTGALLALAAGESLAWALGAALLRRPWRYPDPWHPGNTLRMVLVALIAPAPLALLAVRLGGGDPLSGAGRARAITLWLGDANGILTVGPVALLAAMFLLGGPWMHNTPAVPLWGRWPVSVIAAQVLTAVAAVGVEWQAGPQAGAARHYLYFLPVVWAALRWGLGGAAIASLALNLAAVLVEPAALRAGPSGFSEPLVFLLGLSTTGLLLGSVTSARAREQARSHRRARQLEAAELVSGAGSWEWEPGSGRVWWSAGVRRLLELPADRWSSLDDFLARVHADDAPRLRAEIDRVARDAGDFDQEVRLTGVAGEIRFLAVRGTLRPDRGGGLRVTASCQDRTAQRRSEARERHAALHDALTGLPNRSHLLDRLAQLPPGYAVLLTEVDRLEAVNDFLGHRAGDEIIAAVAERLRRRMNGGGMVARLGGGEFALLLEQADSAAVRSLARAAIAELGDPVPLAGGEVLPGGRVGAALGVDGVNPEEVLRQARTALFHARHAGRDRFAMFEPRMQIAAAERLRLVGELHRALYAGELCMAYQPVVSLRSGAARAVEALVRWRHPQRGLLLAGSFVPAAEEAGLMAAVDEWGLATACREFHASLREAGLLAVNVSAREAAHPRFRGVVEAALAESGLRPAQLMVEVTESVLLEDTEAATASLRDLSQLGVGIALDDFGSGYSSLRYLHRFPVAAVKIDRSFVEHIDQDARSRAVVRAVLAVAQSIGATTVAEGIETAAQENVLRDLGCAYAQGFLYAPGLLGADAASWLAARRDERAGVGEVEPLGPVSLIP